MQRLAFSTTAALRAAAALTVLLACLQLAVLQVQSAEAATATASLFDDDGGAVLFDGAQPLVPGRQQTACLAVGTSAPPPESTVSVLATDLAGNLIDHLRLRVEIGSGGTFGDCGGFVGADVFDGPIADLAVSEGVDTGWRPSSDDVRTFRFTASVDDAGAEAGALGRLVWVLKSSEDPGSEPGPDPTDDPTVDPTPDPADPTETPTSPATPTPTTTVPAATPTQTDGAAVPLDPGGAPGSGTESPDVELGSPQSSALVDSLAEMAALMLKSFGFGLWWLLMIFVFLAVQHRLDAGDPKLALASVLRATQLRFTHPHRLEES